MVVFERSRLAVNNQVAAEFYFDDGDVLYGVYSGTLNVMRAVLSPDPDVPVLWADLAREHALRQRNPALYEELQDAIEACSHAPEHVIAVCGWRGGIAWHGSACRSCLLFRGPFCLTDLDAEQVLDVKSVQPLLHLTPLH